MKKRILSIALVVAMVVAMVPAIVISTLAAPWHDGYDTHVLGNNETITVDGQLDDAYLLSEKIIPTNYHTLGVEFEAYTAVSDNGVYVFATIFDSTITKQSYQICHYGDKFQFYLSIGNNTTYKAGYVEVDYNNNVFPGGWTVDANNQTLATTKNAGEGYWTAELLITWDQAADVKFTSINELNVHVGLQANNYQPKAAYAQYSNEEEWKAHTAAAGSEEKAYENKGLAYDAKGSGDMWSSDYYYNFLKLYFDNGSDTIKAYALKGDEEVVVDGAKDSIYANSTEVTSVYGSGTGSAFKAYLVASDEGLYMFADITDTTITKTNATAANAGDKFQIYFGMFNGVNWTNASWYHMDYLGQIQAGGVGSKATPDYAYTTTVDQGWTAEMFIPWTVFQMGPTQDVDLVNELDLCVGFQSNNGDDSSYMYSDRNGGRYWQSAKAMLRVDITDVVDYSKVGFIADYREEEKTIDGTKDAGYTDFGKRPIVTVAKYGTNEAKDASYFGSFYTSFDDNYLYILYDGTYTSEMPDKDYIQIYYKFIQRGYGNTQIYRSASYGTNGVKAWGFYNNSTLSVAYGANGEVEVKMAIPEAEKELIKKEGFAAIGLAIQFSTYNSMGRDSDKLAYNCGDTSSSTSYWDSSYAERFPTMILQKEFADITSANVALGDSITVNYYATVNYAADNVSMKFTMNGKETVVEGVRTYKADNEYKFAFEGIAPQCMGDLIDAELIVDGAIVDVENDYSVKANVTNLAIEEAEKDDMNYELCDLIHDLLEYGAAAQIYTKYNTTELVNATFEEDTGLEDYGAVVDTISGIYREIGDANVAGAEFSAAGVYHANTNKLYAKIAVTSANVANLTVTINDKNATLEAIGNGEYIVYSDDIKVTEFGDCFTFVLSDGETDQTLNYSVNDYCAVKYAEDNANATLANALYAYGVSAEAYIAG